MNTEIKTNKDNKKLKQLWQDTSIKDYLKVLQQRSELPKELRPNEPITSAVAIELLALLYTSGYPNTSQPSMPPYWFIRIIASLERVIELEDLLIKITIHNLNFKLKLNR